LSGEAAPKERATIKYVKEKSINETSIKKYDIEELGKICFKNFKDSFIVGEPNFEFLNDFRKHGNSNEEVIYGLFWKTFDESKLESDILETHFANFADKIFDKLNVKPADINKGISKFHSEIVNFECDFPELPNYYARIFLKLHEIRPLEIKSISFNSKFENKEDFVPCDFFVKFIMAIMNTIIEDRDKFLELDKEFKFKEFYQLQETLNESEEHTTLTDNKDNLDHGEQIFTFLTQSVQVEMSKSSSF